MDFATRKSFSPSVVSQDLHDRIVVLRDVRIGTIRAHFDPLPVFLDITGIPGAVLQSVHRAIAKQAIEIRKPLMAREIFAIPVFKKTIGILHDLLLVVRGSYGRKALQRSTNQFANPGLEG